MFQRAVLLLKNAAHSPVQQPNFLQSGHSTRYIRALFGFLYSLRAFLLPLFNPDALAFNDGKGVMVQVINLHLTGRGIPALKMRYVRPCLVLPDGAAVPYNIV